VRGVEAQVSDGVNARTPRPTALLLAFCSHRGEWKSSPFEREARFPGRLWSVEDVPETRFAQVGWDRIAYQVFGEGPPDLLWMSSLGDCIDFRWEYPPYASFLRRLGSFSRVVLFDRRGSGASDPVSLEALPAWEEWADDALAVLDEVGSERAVVLGQAEGGAVAILFAASHPNRTQALILANTWLRSAEDLADLYPDQSDLDGLQDALVSSWGTESYVDLGFQPDSAGDPEYRRWLPRSTRLSCSPREAASYMKHLQSIDVHHALSTIRVPTLVIQRKNLPFLSPEAGRQLAEGISNARFVEVEGADFSMFTGLTTEILGHIETFLTGAAPSTDADRALATILFSDIAGSTELAAVLGDHRWRGLLDSHDAVMRTIIDRHRGRLIKQTGDGAMATFDGPGRALRCAFSLRDALEPLGITIRAGLHTGEVELRGHDIGGIGVHVAARVLDQAGPGEVVTSAAVPLLVAGSGFAFEDRGEHELKGVPGIWRLYRVLS
jgi:class 3 adenylate cyclase/pimeloyl-ACP methyl ester carboxylesterase